MPVDPAIIAAITSAIGSTSSIIATSAPWDAFEAYVFSLVLTAARTEGATVELRDVNGCVSPTPFIFRTSPGYIGSTVRPFGYALIEFPSKRTLEAHVGIRVAGKSGVLHECDVCVLFQDEANTCRSTAGASPRVSQVIMAMECKYYASTIPLDLARSFMGLLVDLGQENRFFIVNTGSASVQQLLTKHRKAWDSRIIPSSPIDVNRLLGVLGDTFKKYKNNRDYNL